jgi:hypothetical protein
MLRTRGRPTAPQVRLHQRRQAREVALQHHRRRARRAGQQCIAVACETRPETGWTGVHQQQEQRNRDDDIHDRPELRVAPRRQNQRLRQHDAGQCEPPPPARAEDDASRGADQEHRGNQPQRPAEPGDRDPQLWQRGPPECFRGAEQVQQPVKSNQYCECNPHVVLLDIAE